jgi:hypothetical protein
MMPTNPSRSIAATGFMELSWANREPAFIIAAGKLQESAVQPHYPQLGTRLFNGG